MKIYACGEALIDFIPEHDNSQLFTQFAGGAPANVAVAVARLNYPSAFIGNVGNDAFGRFLRQSLKKNGVDVSKMKIAKQASTAIAIVSLDEHGERDFNFYGTNAAHTTLTKKQVNSLSPKSPSILHICSNTFSQPHLLEFTCELIDQFRALNSLISLDINFRSSFWQNPDFAADTIWSVARECDIVKASREELEVLYPTFHDTTLPKHLLKQKTKLLTITDGYQPIKYYRHL